MSTSPYVIPSLPDHLDSALRARAAAEHKPLDAVIIEALQRGLGPSQEQHSDLDFLVGSWEDDPAFDEAIEAFEVVDEDLWK